MKVLLILVSLCAVLGIVYGHTSPHGDKERNLLTELIHRVVSAGDSGETQALKMSAIEAVAKAAVADPCFIRNCPPGGK